MGAPASNGGPQAEQAADRQYRDTQDIVRHRSSPSLEQITTTWGQTIAEIEMVNVAGQSFRQHARAMFV
jgi:hypothetical protein